jgi:hypothetical protein
MPVIGSKLHCMIVRQRKELFVIAGKTCATEAASLSYGMYNEAVWIESIVAPFGNLTLNGLIDLVLLRQ